MAAFIRRPPAGRHVPPTERFGVVLAAAGLALAALDAAGPAWRGWYVASPAQAGLHAGLGGAGALLLVLEGRARVLAARGVGVALLALAALGTLVPALLGLAPRLGLGFEVLENATHALLGAWGAWAAGNETRNVD